MGKAVRRKVIIGNWKMHKTIGEATAFIAGLTPTAKEVASMVGLAVPFTALASAAAAAKGTVIAIGAQNVSQAEGGAYTGEISCAMIKDAGAIFALVGHSERRRYHHEDDGMVNRKVHGLLAAGLQPVVCVGETLSEMESGRMKEVLHRQLTQGLHGLTAEQLEASLIAYEPVWAIGTGKAASPEDARLAHAYCRSVIKEVWGEAVSSKARLLYGGSVTVQNAAELGHQEGVDGLLIGGASLSLNTFSEIVRKF